MESDPFAAAGGFLHGEAAGGEGREGFIFLGAQDAGKDEGAAGFNGRGDSAGGAAEDFAEDVGDNHGVTVRRVPAQEVLRGEFQSSAMIAAGIGAGGADGQWVVVEGFDAGGAEFFGGDGQNAGAGADVQGGPSGRQSGGFFTEEAQARGGGGVFAGAESHGSGDT